MSTVEDEPGTEIVVRETGTLFHTNDPGVVVARATEVARVLSTVLKERNLTKRIGPKDHVLVEGWTLCGSMLGVFPIVQWTRRIEGGWEARVEARTLEGATVGAAEAMCLDSETRWASADEYAIRSMAQTRATSKAMRGPLGFIVQLAGFEATPAEEMPENGHGKREFDPGRDLLPGAISGEGFVERVAAALQAIDASVDWKETFAPLDYTRDDSFYRRISNFIEKLGDIESFPPKSDEEIQAALAWAFEGAVLELVRPVEEEIDESTVEAAERDEEPVEGEVVEDDEPAPISSDNPIGSDDDIPFG